MLREVTLSLGQVPFPGFSNDWLQLGGGNVSSEHFCEKETSLSSSSPSRK
jgi:hypothetical protein